MSSATVCHWRHFVNSDVSYVLIGMPRFDLYRPPAGQQLVMDVQSDHASAKAGTRVVAPLISVDELGALITGLNAVIRIHDRDYAFVAQSLATLTRSELGERLGSLSEHDDEMARALDILLAGF